jgi:hypothetical protein
MRWFLVGLAASALCSCAGSEAVQSNTMIIQAEAAPFCRGTGALRVAQQSAAIETIKAGYDRYIITGSQAQNNVVASQMPGTYNTTIVGSRGFYQGTTTYQPGPTIVAGSHDRGLAIAMFREGEPGAAQAISARDTLGPDWQDKVKSGVHTCL